MPTYENAKIYIIQSDLTPQVYVGSTTMSLSKRLSCHKSMHRRKVQNISTSSILDLDPNPRIELLEQMPSNCTKKQMLQRERHYIESYGDLCVNERKPCLRDGEMKLYMRAYYKAKKGEIRKLQKAYYRHQRSPFGQLCRMYHA